MSSTARRLARALTAAALTLGAPALAQPVAPPPLASPEADAAQTLLPDALFRSLGDRVVALRLTTGGEIIGRLLGVEPTLLVVSTSPSNQVITLPRAAVAEVRLLGAAPPPPPIYVNRDGEPVLQPAPRQRHVGLNLSAAPGFLLDLDYGRFRAFANLGIVLPLATNGALVPFSLGLGGGIPVSARNPGLKLDLFAFFSVIGDASNHSSYTYNDTLVSFGAGLGLHNTWRNVLTLGFTIPVLGYSVFTAQSNTGSSSSKTSTGIAYFYLAGVESLPIGFIGYRF